MNGIVNNLRRYGIVRFVTFAISEFYARVWKYKILHSYSQNGEDLTLDKLLGYKKRGVYVDIGAYDPYRFSNTMRFYERGWTGINIEPDVQRFKHFSTKRPRDINLNIGIANKKGSLTFFVMDPATLSTFVKSQALEYVKNGFVIKEEKKITVVPLGIILEKYLENKRIDFLSLDVEGFEKEVLVSNDWKKFRPKFLCIETAIDANKSAMNSLLKDRGYTLISDNGLNSFYKNTGNE